MECQSCGARIGDQRSQCPHCGAQLAAGDDPTGRQGPGDRSHGEERPTQGGGPSERGQSSPQARRDQSPNVDRAPQQAPAGDAREGAGPQQGKTGSQPRPTGQGGGHNGQHGGGHGHQQGSGHGRQHGGRQPRGDGPTLSTRALALLSELPWRGGIVAGVLVYLFGYASLATLTTGLGSDLDGLVPAAELFFGVVTFVAPSDLLVQVYAPGPDTSQALLAGQYDGVIGLVYVVVPALLYLTGRLFTEWNATEDDGIETYLATGGTVVLGTLPVAIGIAALTGTDVVRGVVLAGIAVPAFAGVFGSAMAWVFRDASRTASYGAGVFVGLLGYALVLGLIVATAGPLLGLGSGGLLLVALAAVSVSVNVAAFSVGGGGLLAFLLVALPLVGMGYFRARRGPDEVDDLLEGGRAGASLVAGFSSFAFVLVAIYAVLTTPWAADAVGSTGSLFAGGAPGGLAVITSPAVLLGTFLLAGVVFPVLFGGLGGVIAGYQAGAPGAAHRGPAHHRGRGSSHGQARTPGQGSPQGQRRSPPGQPRPQQAQRGRRTGGGAQNQQQAPPQSQQPTERSEQSRPPDSGEEGNRNTEGSAGPE